MYPKPHDLKYVSASGVTVRLDTWPYLWEVTDLLDYSWGYAVTDKTSGYGVKLTKFTRREQERAINIAVFQDGLPVSPYVAALTAIFEADVLALTPGRLYIGTQYCTGYITGSGKTVTRNLRMVKLALKFVTEYPFWITEESLSFPIFTDTADGFVLPMALPMGFVATLNTRQLMNGHYAATKAIITIYGPATVPSFRINAHTYAMGGILQSGERYVIDQSAGTIVKVASSGAQTNAFNLRGKVNSVFEPIPSGENTLYYDGDFAIDITLLKERSEPLW